MYELYPYFTNDGTVGLFSPTDDDIYHSTYGALTESWQKFVHPSMLENYLKNNDSVKILDICYGIGYNTKTALQVFIDNVLKNNSKNNKIQSSISAIDGDNNSWGKIHDYSINIEEEIESKTYSNAEIYGDNINAKSSLNNNMNGKKILVDAVDIDKILINLSPFITNGLKTKLLPKNLPINNYLSKSVKDKLQQIQKMKNSEINLLPINLRLKQEVSIVILEKLLENNSEYLNDKILQAILNHKKYSPYFSRYMINYANFYQNQRSNSNKKLNLSAFLHNIYYRYISKSYKNAKKVLSNNKIDLNFYSEDARMFVKNTLNRYNFIFLDAFTPTKCPALWSLEFFRELYSKLEDDGLLLTYSSSAVVRNALLQNGFYVGKIYDSSMKKIIGTVAAKNQNLVQHNLDERDLNLIKSRAGICYRDKNLELDCQTIIANRENEVQQSELISSSQALKSLEDEGDNVKSI